VLRQIELGCWGARGESLGGTFATPRRVSRRRRATLRLDQVNTQSWQEANKGLWRLFEEFAASQQGGRPEPVRQVRCGGPWA
jgi:hypothetical protein